MHGLAGDQIKAQGKEIMRPFGRFMGQTFPHSQAQSLSWLNHMSQIEECLQDDHLREGCSVDL